MPTVWPASCACCATFSAPSWVAVGLDDDRVVAVGAGPAGERRAGRRVGSGRSVGSGVDGRLGDGVGSGSGGGVDVGQRARGRRRRGAGVAPAAARTASASRSASTSCSRFGERDDREDHADHRQRDQRAAQIQRHAPAPRLDDLGVRRRAARQAPLLIGRQRAPAARAAPLGRPGGHRRVRRRALHRAHGRRSTGLNTEPLRRIVSAVARSRRVRRAASPPSARPSPPAPRGVGSVRRAAVGAAPRPARLGGRLAGRGPRRRARRGRGLGRPAASLGCGRRLLGGALSAGAASPASARPPGVGRPRPRLAAASRRCRLARRALRPRPHRRRPRRRPRTARTPTTPASRPRGAATGSRRPRSDGPGRAAGSPASAGRLPRRPGAGAITGSGSGSGCCARSTARRADSVSGSPQFEQ